MYQAKTVVVEENSKIDASSIKYGIGGEIVVWSDIHAKSGKTLVEGSLQANGGLEGGDGGRIEIEHSVQAVRFGIVARSRVAPGRQYGV